MLGPITAVSVGVGGAIGSGIFATPGVIAGLIHSPWMILLIWLLCGGITMMQSLVSAELATRFPQAGGEYQYLKAAYGEFAAFFFGWSGTIFIIGGGGGTIAAALGVFAADLIGWNHPWAASLLGCAAIVAVLIVNVAGLRTGAAAQNVLTGTKIVAVLGIAVGAIVVSGRIAPAPPPDVSTKTPPELTFDIFLLALLPAFWSYTGTTDSVRLAEEIKDVHRALPRALIGSALLITTVYMTYNYALLCALAPSDMAGVGSVPGVIFAGVQGLPAREIVLAASALICLGALSACMLANVRLTYALARDGLAFRFLGRVSEKQAPVGALVVAAGFASAFVLYRDFAQLLGIYFFASAFLFGLTYLSLIVFRLRDARNGGPAATVFRAPGGVLMALGLIVLEIAIIYSNIARDVRTWLDPAVANGYDSLWTLLMLGLLAGLFFVWKRATR